MDGNRSTLAANKSSRYQQIMDKYLTKAEPFAYSQALPQKASPKKVLLNKYQSIFAPKEDDDTKVIHTLNYKNIF